ncbi:hypothetical protein MS3_00005582 [Schistosoma haematobium]|uniref:Uncharacterized protein n=1 Tax=Schistosoma haematobium TaxID=6185 RepID=A0A6A5D8M3_SCHHA|nr:hypothetical protein MS3_00005582 [Schistosoma haematobium]KAH9588079.1 hypothetical protein MS3_00005582 [Schistosoma haematobium]
MLKRLVNNKVGIGFSDMQEMFDVMYRTVIDQNSSLEQLLLAPPVRLLSFILNQSKSVNHTCDQNMTSAKKQPYVNPRIRGISDDDEKEVLRKLQLLCRYDSENEMVNLETVTNKWKKAAWKALQELISFSGEKTTEQEILSKVGIDPATITLKPEEL